MSGRSYSVALWVYAEGTTNVGYVAGKTTGANGWFWRRASGDASAWDAGHNGTSHVTTSAGTVTADAWQHMALTFNVTTADMFMYKAGSSIGSNLAMPAQTATTTSFGVGNRVAGDRDWEGRFAELGVWLDYVLDSTDLANLAAGESPLLQATKPTLYAPLYLTVKDYAGSATGTNVNSTPTIAHPDGIIYQHRMISTRFRLAGHGGLATA